MSEASSFIYLVICRSWDYDFHEDVVAAFGCKDEALTYVRAQKPYDRERETGLVVEEWRFGPAGSHWVIFPLALEGR